MTVINSNRVVRGPVTAIPLVAGKGVRLVADTVNNRWIAEVDETVLWESEAGSSASTGATFTLSEPFTNFERIKIIGIRSPSGGNASTVSEYQVDASHNIIFFRSAILTTANDSTVYEDWFKGTFSTSGTTYLLTINHSFRKIFYNTTIETQANNSPVTLFKIVGVNRIASN